MDEHFFCMHPCIRPTCTHGLNGLAQEGTEGVVEIALNRPVLRLDLPTTKGSAIVGQSQECTHYI